MNSTSVALIATALGGLIWQIYINKRKWECDESHFCLTSALDAFESARNLLKDGNNDRVIWILAARALTRGRDIANKITEQVHKKVLEVELDKYRIIFGDILGRENEDKTMEFFQGNTFFEDGQERNPNPRHATPLNIPPSTLKVVWDFAEYPEDYTDPVSNDESFPDSVIDRGVNAVLYPGLIAYLKMLRRNRTR
ncbi:MAG: hypothetical protein F3745_05905 [Nitrospinae bacterium]|nr:hypothetical protein [Nitrospinota bacterium]